MKNVMRLVMGMLAGSMVFSGSAFAYLSEGKSLTGSQKEVRLLSDQYGPGPLAVQDAHAKYAEAVSHGNVFICANPAGTSVTTVAGLSALNPALTLWNPPGSGKNLVLLEDSIDITASPAAAVGFSLAYNTVLSSAPATVTAGTVANANLGLNTTPLGQCYRAATLAATPVAIRYVGSVTGASSISPVVMIDNVDGKIILPPGTAISVQTTAAAAILAHFVWEEMPLNSF